MFYPIMILIRKVLHRAVGPPRGSLLMSYNGISFIIIKKSKRVKKNVLFFIGVKLDFMRLAHHFATFLFDFFDHFSYIFRF